MTDFPDPEPSFSPHMIAAAERMLAKEEAASVQRGDERRRWLQRLCDGNDARERLEAQAFYPCRDNEMVDLYEGEQAAVIAEVPEGQRKDGWTVERRLHFLDRLAEHGSVVSACKATGVTRQSVYKLRPRAPAFAAAMDEAMRGSAALLADTLFDRALHGHEVPVLHDGEVVATRTVHHDALGIYLLKVRDPLNYAPIGELERWKKLRAIDAAPSPTLSAEPRAALSALLVDPATLTTSTTSLGATAPPPGPLP